MKRKTDPEILEIRRVLKERPPRTFDEIHAEAMLDPEFKALWEAGESKRQAMLAQMDARIAKEQHTREKATDRADAFKLGLAA